MVKSDAGRKLPPPQIIGGRIAAVAVGAALVVGTIGCLGGCSGSSSDASTAAASTTEAATSAPATTEAASTEAQSPVTSSTKIPGATVSQQNALDRAQSTLLLVPISHDELVDQLVLLKFSEEDATWAADNCGADWNDMAAQKAQTYLNTTSFSHDGLVTQLEYEKFTPEQAEYGVSAVGL